LPWGPEAIIVSSTERPDLLTQTTMETIEGTPAAWPVTHTFFCEERGEQITHEAETAAIALKKLTAGAPWHLVRLTYLSSVDADGRFVYDF
jgi:hypothetical protein